MLDQHSKFKKEYYKVISIRDVSRIKDSLIYCSYVPVKISEDTWDVKHFGPYLEVITTADVFEVTTFSRWYNII